MVTAANANEQLVPHFFATLSDRPTGDAAVGQCSAEYP